jgi:TonB family protein
MLRILLSVLLATAIYTPAMAQEALDFAEVSEFTVAIWDETIENVRGTAGGMQIPRPEEPKDARGRTMSDDAKELILPPGIANHLNELRAEARAKESDPVALKRVLDAARPVVELEVFKLMLTTSYWLAFSTFEYHHKLLEPWLANATQPEREAVRAHLESARGSILKLRSQALSETSTPTRIKVFEQLTAEKARAAAFFNQRRMELVEQQAGKAGAPPPKSRKRTAPCPPPVAPVAGKDRASFGANPEALETVYPAAAKRMEVEGTVHVRAQISNTGCMEYAEVAKTSGVDALDEAALTWTERTGFHPAGKDGKAIADTMRFAVKFDLQD